MPLRCGTSPGSLFALFELQILMEEEEEDNRSSAPRCSCPVLPSPFSAVRSSTRSSQRSINRTSTVRSPRGDLISAVERRTVIVPPGSDAWQVDPPLPSVGARWILMATLLFILPNMKQEGEKILDWTKCKKLQWNVILLLGAGFAIADGVRTSGLADLISSGLVFLRNVPPLMVTPLVSLLSATITEFASNNATATLLVPLLIQLANTIGMHPLLLVIPGAIGAEFAYWLPTGTPSNVVGFTTGRITIRDMFMVGVPLKAVGIVALGVLMPTLGMVAFGTDKWNH